MTVRLNRFADCGTLGVWAGANRFMCWAKVSLVRWEWNLHVYFTV